MSHTIRYLLIGFLFLWSPLFSQENTLEEAGTLEEQGKFREASALLRSALQDPSSQLTSDQRKRLAFELDRLHRIRIDYSLTQEDLFKQLQKSLKDFSEQEYSAWIRDGRFDSRTIDDTMRFVGPSRSNLFWRYPELGERRIHPSADTTFEGAVWNAVSSISALSFSARNHLVLPKRFKAKMTVTVEPNAVPPGDTIRA